VSHIEAYAFVYGRKASRTILQVIIYRVPQRSTSTYCSILCSAYHRRREPYRAFRQHVDAVVDFAVGSVLRHKPNALS
jgi:hypothetical protein